MTCAAPAYGRQPDVPGYRGAVLSFAGAAVLELLAEPLWLLAQLQLNVGLRVCAAHCMRRDMVRSRWRRASR